MRETVVGMKCPDCVRMPSRVRYGTPRQYLGSIGAGLATAAALGAILSLLRIGVFGLLLPLVVGLGVGEIVYRTSGRRGQPAFQVIAGATTIAGLGAGALVVGLPPSFLVTPGWILGAVIAGGAAAFRARG
ncbi:MAG: hypothetical protein ACRDI1_01325 [Actinomycetota bacterium]